MNTKIDGDDVARADYHQQLSQLAGSFDQVYNHLQVYQSEVGSRVSYINNYNISTINILMNRKLRLVS